MSTVRLRPEIDVFFDIVSYPDSHDLQKRGKVIDKQPLSTSSPEHGAVLGAIPRDPKVVSPSGSVPYDTYHLSGESSDGRGHSLSEEAGHLKSHVRELREATASLERSHDLETRLLKGNRTLQEQSVECEQPKEEYRWVERGTECYQGYNVCTSRSGGGHESFQILPREAQLGAQATLLVKALMSKTREWELLQLSAANIRDKERVKLLSFQTELVKQLLAEKSFP
eukprot:Em0006g772a